jgi:HK97 family phage major capsid protein
MSKHENPSAFDAPIELKTGESFSDDASDVVTKALADLTATIDDRIKDIETKAGDAAALVSRLDKIEARLNRPGIIGRAPETKEDAGEIQRKAFLDYARGSDFDRKALTVATNGGYLIPSVMLGELQKNLVLYSPIRSVARVTSIGGGTVTLPKRTANLTGAWVDETEARSESAPTYGSQAFTAYEYATYIDVSLQLLEDSQFDLQAELMRDLAEEFGRAEGNAFTVGNGTKKPKGLFYNPVVGSTVNAAAATVAPDDLISLYHALPSFYAANAVWLMNRTTIGAIRKFKATTGEYLWAPGAGENGLVPGNSGVLLGRPVVEIPDAPDIAPSTISIAFGDMQAAYRIVDRIGIEIVRDDFTQRANGKVRFHARRRVGGDVAKTEAVRFLKTTA